MRRTNERCCESVARHGERLLHYCADGPKAVIYWRKNERECACCPSIYSVIVEFYGFCLQSDIFSQTSGLTRGVKTDGGYEGHIRPTGYGHEGVRVMPLGMGVRARKLPAEKEKTDLYGG